MTLPEIGKLIRATRRSLNLTQQALAKRAGVSRYTILKLETGQASDIQFKTLTAVLQALRLTVEVVGNPVSGVTVLGSDK
ncbi:MAG: helix-turn-helix domain-containing protein [Gammaproteobacteria bacterium]|nr:helix-turn-helix domain-containing protein [Gammaproteobacteria bacterium]